MNNYSKYNNYRNQLSRGISSIIKESYPCISIRGSWANGEFHLSTNNLISFSDLDLLSTIKLDISSLAALKQEIKNRIRNLIEIKVSIQDNLDLSFISLSDSYYKNILEFILRSEIGFQDDLEKDYLIAKTTILLSSPDNLFISYNSIVKLLENNISQHLMDIKLGIQDKLDYILLDDYIKLSSNKILKDFYRSCVICNISNEYKNYVVDQFLKSKTISTNLKNYILTRLNT